MEKKKVFAQKYDEIRRLDGTGCMSIKSFKQDTGCNEKEFTIGHKFKGKRVPAGYRLKGKQQNVTRASNIQVAGKKSLLQYSCCRTKSLPQNTG